MDALVAAKLVLGIALLVAGADALVRGASRVAAAIGVSPLAIGLTVVAYGTSAPELAVSASATWIGPTDLAVGNAVGSNLFNLLCVLGLAAAIQPLVIAHRLVQLDVPIMIGVAALLSLFALDGRVGRGEAAVLAALCPAYTAFAIALARRQRKSRLELSRAYRLPPQRSAAAWARNGALVGGGLALLVLGARWLVAASVATASALGVSDLVIGLTLVAAGTGLPELATSLVASLRGEQEIAIGNVVGSNIFNVLLVLGWTALASADGLSVPRGLVRFDLPVLLAVSLACLPIFFAGHRISRWQGVVFFAYYLAYVSYVVLAASEHDALPRFAAVMLRFVIPLTVLTIGVLAFRAARGSPARRA